MELTNPILSFIETDPPSVLVLVKCAETIALFMGISKYDLLKHHVYSNKRLYRLYHKRFEEEYYTNAMKKFDSMNIIGLTGKTIDQLYDYLTRSVISSYVDTMANMRFNSNARIALDLLLDLVVPYDFKEEILTLNWNDHKTKLMNYIKDFKKKTQNEMKLMFIKFLLRGENYEKIPFQIGNFNKRCLLYFKKQKYYDIYKKNLEDLGVRYPKNK